MSVVDHELKKEMNNITIHPIESVDDADTISRWLINKDFIQQWARNYPGFLNYDNDNSRLGIVVGIAINGTSINRLVKHNLERSKYSKRTNMSSSNFIMSYIKTTMPFKKRERLI